MRTDSNLLRAMAPGAQFETGVSGQDEALMRERVREGDPTNQNDRAAIAWWKEERIRQAKNATAEIRGKADEAVAFYEDDTHVAVSPDGQLIHPEQLKTTAIPVSYRNCNFYAVMVDAICARILSEKAVAKAIAGGMGMDAQRNKQAAKGAELTIQHIERVNNDEDENQALVQMQVLGGVGYQKVWYDDAAWGKVLMQDNNVHEAQTGEITWSAVPMQEILHEPQTKWRHIGWATHGYRRSIGWVRQAFPDRGQYVWVGREDRANEFSLDTMMRGVPVERAKDRDPDSTQVDVFECFARALNPATGRPGWLSWTFCEDTVLSPPHFLRDIPLIPVYFNQSLRTKGPLTLAWDLIPMQREVRQTLEGWCFRRRIHQYPKPILPQSMKMSDWDNSPRPMRAPVDPRTGKMIPPVWMEPPKLDSQGVNEFLDKQLYLMSERAGIHETSRGMVGSGITSGKQAQIAAAQDNTNLQRPVQNYRTGKSRLWTVVLRLADEKYPRGKLIEVIGRDNRYMAEAFQKGVGEKIVGIRIGTISRIPLEPQQRQDFVKMMAELGLFAEGAERQRREFLRFMEFESNIEDDVDEILVAHAMALEEEELLSQGNWAPVGELDLHEFHLEIHYQAANAPDARADKESYDLRKQHIDMHINAQHTLSMEEAQRQAELQQVVQPQLGGQMAGQ